EEPLGVQGFAQEPVGPHQAGHRRGGTAPQAALERDPVGAADLQAGRASPNPLPEPVGRLDHPVRPVPGKLLLPLARQDDVRRRNLHGRPLLQEDQLNLVGQVQGQAEGVEAGPQVGHRRRCLDQNPPAGGHASIPSRASITADSSSGTTWGSVTPATAWSGSFRPWPVSTQTTVSPPRKYPWRASLATPATEMAEAGSQKTPSWAAMAR